METRAPFIVVGAFVLAAIGAVFAFVYWLHNTAGTGARTVHHIQFDGSVSGLLVGAAVLFNGIRVGEVTNLGLAAGRPRQVDATIAVTSGTPVHADTKVGLDFQGLTGVPVIALEGGKEVGASTDTQTLIADPAAGQSMTQAARNALAQVDSVLADNAEPLKSTIANLKIFTEGLAKNTGGLDSIVAGLVKMTGGGEPANPKTIYDLSIPSDFASPKTPLKEQLVMPTPTAILLLDTQRFLLEPNKELPEFANAQWADSIPKMLQVKLIQSFENYDVAHAPLRSTDTPGINPQILVDVRSFQINTGAELTAEIGFSARILNKDGQVVASRLFQQRKKLDKPDPASAVAAFDDAFGSIATDLITWTANTL
ncbi:ABC-type transport auxiliary lipoprotein family protein [Bradyrhizobium erythrophlei]|uniref:Phospholipid/cholesterol/gamma-HCH transport system substrate-binding protein n=1 Tax=Bradyrhizobium erythrophlei TaxID=1437360 RepID=A0A1M5MTE6_9BRAD|nr:ABC-type transport auxiliary lipoprotein family protein [Bradyrhizobium erythrophlei]SHG80497.1 phospholipid/cholesterol/gamma-HCH transport system substrate-binding protein [Bradyrhizobium erythrophlei]